MLRETLKQILEVLPAKGPIFSAIRYFGRPPFYKSLRVAGAFEVPLGDGAQLRIDHPHGYGIETEWFWRGITGWEAISIQAWMNLCRRLEGDSVVFDIGACEGIYALTAKALSGSSRVVAIEALPENFERLKRNIELNSFDIEALEVACSDRDGEAKFFASEGVSNEASLLAKSDAESQGSAHTVRTRSVDSLVEELALPRVDLVKIDVEGAEPAVLSGMEHSLANFRPVILIEILTQEAGVQIDRIMKPLAYVYFDINDHPGKGPLRITRLDRIAKGISLNWLLVPAEKVDTHMDAWEAFIAKH
jgi:FkbM family methyltransferase